MRAMQSTQFQNLHSSVEHSTIPIIGGLMEFRQFIIASTQWQTKVLFGTASTKSAMLIRQRGSDVAYAIFPRAVQTSVFCVGGGIFRWYFYTDSNKFAGGIFILTQSKFIKSKSQLFVHFHDNLETEAKLLVCDSSHFVVM